MTAKQKATKIEQIKTVLREHRYVEDAHGNFVKEEVGPPFRKVRYYFTNVSLQKESQIPASEIGGYKQPARWVRIRSGYLKDITVSTDGKITGLKTSGCGK